VIGSAKFISITEIGFTVVGYSPEFIFGAVFLAILIGGIFVGWIFSVVMNVLGGTGGALEGISAVTYSIFPVSIGTLAASTAAYIPVFGPVSSYVMIFLFGALGYAILYRATKEFFDVGMVTSFVGVSLLLAAGTGAFYASFLASASDINTILQFIKP
jgi:hypothetical protein